MCVLVSGLHIAWSFEAAAVLLACNLGGWTLERRQARPNSSSGDSFPRWTHASLTTVGSIPVASLRIQRPHDGGGILRRLRVEINGQRVAGLKQGESADIPLPAGTHTVLGRMDWTSSPTLDIELGDDDQVRVEVALPFSALWNMVLRPHTALTIRRI